MARDTMALDHAIVGAQSRRQPREVSMDALSEVLKALCTSGGIPLDTAFAAPRCLASRVGPEDFPQTG